jgi:hypothetical protein
MHILLRHALTGQYYRSAGKWTTKPEQAHDFKFIESALRSVRKMKSPNMEVNLAFDRGLDVNSFRLWELLAVG